jgi:lambda family phage tail tape measure protein
MATQNINIVIRTAGGTTVVRQLNQIGQAATNAISPLARLQRQIDLLMSALAIGQIAKWADEWTSASNKVLVFAKSQEEANQVVDEIYQLSQRVRQPLGEMVQLYHRLSIGARELGTSTKQNLEFTESIGQALAIQGTSATMARGALLQLSQAMGMSRIRAQEFNSMLENLPLVLVTVAKNLDKAGGSTAKLRELVHRGSLSAKEFFEAFTKGAPELATMFAKVDKTFGQAFIILETGIIRYVGEVNRALGVSNKFFYIVSLLVTNLDYIGKALFVVGSAVATAFAPTIITAFAAALVIAATAMGRLVLLLATNPFILIVAATAAVIAFGDSWLVGVDNITTIKDLFSAFVDTVTTGFSTATSTIAGWWGSLVSTVANFYSSASGMTSESVGNWFSAYTTFFSDVEGGFAGMLRVIARTMDAIASFITAGAVLIGRVFSGLPAVVANIFKLVYNGIATWIEKALNVVIDGVNTIRSKVGMSLIDAVRIEKVQVDKKVFQDYGKGVASAVDDGFAIQGGFMEKQLNGILAKAASGAKQRLALNAQKQAVDLTEKPEPLRVPPGAGKPDRANSDFERYNKLTLERIALAAAELSASRELTKAERDRLKFMQDIDASKMTQDQKEMLKLRYEGIYAMDEEIVRRAHLRKAEEDNLQLRQRAYEALLDYSKQLDETFSDIAFETSLLGQNADAQRRMTALRQLDLDMQRALASVRDDPTAAAQVRVQNEEAQKRMIAALDQQIAKQNELNASWQFGANTALSAYLKQVQDVAGGMERAFGNAFSSLEDSVAGFLSTGKMSISSFATSVVNDINRMIAKTYITGPLAAMVQGGMSSGSGIGGFIGNLFGNMFGGGGQGLAWSYAKANGGWAPPNSLQQVNERGPELLSMGGKQYLMTGDKGGMVTPNEGRGGITQHNHFHVTGPIDRRTQTQLAANVGMMTQHALRRNG